MELNEILLSTGCDLSVLDSCPLYFSPTVLFLDEISCRSPGTRAPNDGDDAGEVRENGEFTRGGRGLRRILGRSAVYTGLSSRGDFTESSAIIHFCYE